MGVKGRFAVQRDGDVARLHRLVEHFTRDFVVAAEAGEEFPLEFHGRVGDCRGVVPLHVAEFVGVAGVVPPAEHAPA